MTRPTPAQIAERTLPPHEVKYEPCRLRCMGCSRRSDLLPYAETIPMATNHGWASCSDCNLTLDPRHPEDGPVVPFEAKS